MKVDHNERQADAIQHESCQLAALAHDLSVPMRCVSGAVQSAMSASRRGQAVDGQLHQILLAVQSMERMLAQTVYIPQGRQDVWFTGAMLARELHAMTDRSAERKAQALRIDLSALQRQPMEADYGALTRVLTNLLSNAIQYTPCGGQIALTGHLERQEDGARAVFTVEDNGVGMERAFQARMYLPFVRGRESASQPGCGLGLAIVRQLVDRMHGTIEVRSAPGQGSAFTVRVPVIACPAQ